MGHTKRHHRGGKMVSKGAYGCGFIPALKCIGNINREPNTFSKLMKIQDAMEEWTSREVISKIDPQQKYTLYPTHMCSIDAAAISAQNDINSCGSSLLSNIHRNTKMENISTKYKVLQVPVGDSSLQNFQVPDRDKGLFFKSLKNLFNGLIVMHSNDFFHLDIKPLNVMINVAPNGDYKIRYIDFGISKTLDQFLNEKQMYIANNYLYWPLEYRFLLHRNKMSYDDEKVKLMMKAQVDFYYRNLKDHLFLPDGEFYYEKVPMRNYKMYIEVYNKMREDARVNGKEAMVRNILEKVDVFSLGILLCEMITKHLDVTTKSGKIYFVRPQITRINDPHTIKTFHTAYGLIHQMLHYDPYERISMRDALNLYNNFLEELMEDTNITEYNKKQHYVSNAEDTPASVVKPGNLPNIPTELLSASNLPDMPTELLSPRNLPSHLSPLNSQNSVVSLKQPKRTMKRGRAQRNLGPSASSPNKLNKGFIQANNNKNKNNKNTATTMNLNNLIKQQQNKAKKPRTMAPTVAPTNRVTRSKSRAIKKSL